MSRRRVEYVVIREPSPHPDMPGNFQEVTADCRVAFAPGDEAIALAALTRAMDDLRACIPGGAS